MHWGNNPLIAREKRSLVGRMIAVAADHENLSGRPKRPTMKSSCSERAPVIVPDTEHAVLSCVGQASDNP
jgi:hypothetical protein